MKEKEFQKELLSAFKEIGYSEEMRLESVSFVGENATPHTAKVVFYSDSIRRDSETAVIAIQETVSAEHPDYEKEIKPYYGLGTPIIVLAEYRKLREGSEPRISVCGLDQKDNFKIENDNVIPFSKFKEYVKRNRENFSPRKLEEVKFDPSQSRKFKVEPYLFDRILKISEKELVQRYHTGLNEIIESSPNDEKAVYENSLILLASRILRDKLTVEKKDTWSVNSVSDLIEGAKGINEYFNIPLKYRKILEPLLDFLPSHFDYSQLGIEALGHFYEKAILNKKIKQEFGIYYTQPIIAKTILKRMPIEEIRPTERRLLDPTCGSGSFLVAGYERLTQATYLKVPVDERHKNLINTMYGNDVDEFAAKIAKLTLLLFYPPHKNNWKVSHENALEMNFTKNITNKLGNKKPTIIVGNLPFRFKNNNTKAIGRSRESSSIIFEKCLELLEDKGIMGIILPESFVLYEHHEDKLLRRKLVNDYQIIDRWKLPAMWFNNTNHPAIALIIKKEKPLFKVFTMLELSNLPILGYSNKLNHLIEVSRQSIDLENPPETLVISRYDYLMHKLRNFSNKVITFYDPFSGLKKNEDAKLISEESDVRQEHYIWLDNAEGKNQFFNPRSQEQKLYLSIHDKKNLHPRNARNKLRQRLILNRMQILMRANRNNPSKWASIGLIDIILKNEKGIAPSSSFHPTFLKEAYIQNEDPFLFSLWIIVNHPIINFFCRNISHQKWIKVEDYENFPLPDSWNDIDKIKNLATKAKQLLDLKRKYDAKYKSDGKDDKNKPSTSEVELRNKILSLVKETDKIIYDMYGFTKSEIQQIEDFFGDEKRPGLEELGGDWKQFKLVKKREKKAPSIDSKDLKDFGTSFETLEVDYDKLQVKLAINGLRDRDDGVDVDRDGIWIAITPYMPGWMLSKGKIGWIYLKTYDSTLIEEYPDIFIKDFALLKNAYKTDKEIEESLYGKEMKQDKKVG